MSKCNLVKILLALSGLDLLVSLTSCILTPHSIGLTCLITFTRKSIFQASGLTWTNSRAFVTDLVPLLLLSKKHFSTILTICHINLAFRVTSRLGRFLWIRHITETSQMLMWGILTGFTKLTTPICFWKAKTKDLSSSVGVRLWDRTSTGSTGLATTTRVSNFYGHQLSGTLISSFSVYKWSGLIFAGLEGTLTNSYAQGGSNWVLCTPSPEITLEFKTPPNSPMLWGLLCWSQQGTT